MVEEEDTDDVCSLKTECWARYVPMFNKRVVKLIAVEFR